MAYTPIVDDKKKKKGSYTPIIEGATNPYNADIASILAPNFGQASSARIANSTPALPVPGTPDIVRIAGGAAQAFVAGGARAGVALERALPSIPGIKKSELPLPLNEAGQYQPIGAAKYAFGDKPIGTFEEYGKEIKSTLASFGIKTDDNQFALLSLGVLGTGLDISNPFSSGGKNFTKLVDDVAKSKNTEKLLIDAGIDADIAKNAATKFDVLGVADKAEIERGLIAIEKLQNSIRVNVPTPTIKFSENINDLSAQIVSKYPHLPGTGADILAEDAITLVREGGLTPEEALSAISKRAENTPNQLPSLPELPKIPNIKPGELPIQRTTAGRQTKQVIKANTQPVKVAVTSTDKALLKNQLKAEVRGSRAGYKAGYSEAKESITNQLRSTFGTQLAEVKRGAELAASKARIIARDADRVRGEIVDFVKLTIPQAERGKFLATVKNAKTQKDLIKAFTRIDARASEINLRDGIAELKNIAEKLSESPSVSADYRNKIKDIIGQYELSGHTNATIAKLEATQAYLKRAEATGEDITMPQRILDKLNILTRIPKESLTLAQVQRLQHEIKMLGQLGKTKWKTKQALYEGEKALRKEELLGTATPINSKVYTREVGTKPKAWTQRYIALRNFSAKSRLGLRPIDGFAEITGMTPMKQTLDTSHGAYLNRVVPGVENFKKLEAEMLEAGGALSPESRERVGVYGHRLQTDGYEKLANLGITRAQADAIVLTAEEKNFYDSIQTFNEATYESVRKYSQDVYNVDVGRVENYMSYQTDFSAISDLEMYDRFGDAVANKTKTVEKGFTESRTGAGNQKVQLDALKIAQRHADDVAYMLTTGRDIKQYFEIVNSPEMRKKLGDMGTLGWLEYLDLLARKGGTASSNRIAALDILRQNLGAGVLGFRLSSVAVQVTSFADSIATIGLEHATKGANNIATSKEWRNFVMDNFPEVRAAVGDDIAFREFNDTFLGKVQKVGMAPLVALDGVMRSSAAAGAYEMLARKAGIAVDLAKPNKKLVQEATKLMRDSQGSSFYKDQPLALSTGFGLSGNKSINKTIFTFQSFMLNRWENIERQIWRLGIKEKDYAKAATSTLWLLVFAAMAEEGIRTGVNAVTDLVSNNEPKERDFATNSAMNVVEGIPLLGNIVSSINYSSNPVPVINTAEDVIAGVGSAISGKEPETKLRGGIQALGGVGALSGIPGSSQAAQIGRNAIQKAGSKSNSSGLPGLPELPSLPELPPLPKLPKL